MLRAIQSDITTFSCDALVNAANSSLMGGSGVDGAIHRKGGKAILEACMQIRNRQGSLATGKAVWTPAGNLPARWVIHTVGPVWNGGGKGEADLLADCYRNSLALAAELGARSIAFPGISTGIYKFPADLACRIAVATVREYLASHALPAEVTFVCYDAGSLALYTAALAAD